MGPSYVVFLVTFAIMVRISASAASTSPPSTFIDENKSIVTIGRSLNTGSAVEFPNEERIPQLPSSIREKFKSLFTPTTISEEMLHGWLKDKKTADEAFVRLRLDTTADKLLDQPHFQTWINYANTLNTKTGGKSGSAMSKLTDYYYDAAVARMIESAKKKPGMKEFASDLQTQQFKYWFNGYLTDDPDYVFRALVLAFKVRFRKGNVLDDPLFFTWMNYVKFHDKNTKNQPAGYLTTLKNYYDDGAITILVRMAKKKPSTLEFANKLRDEQIQGWILSGKPPSKVWDIIKGGIVGEKVLGSPEFKALTIYLDRFNKAYPDKKTTSVSILKEYYGKKGPTRAIIEALTSKDPENKNIAKQVETALFGIWLTKYDPTDVFRMLRLMYSEC